MPRTSILKGETRLSVLNELKSAGRGMSVRELSAALGLSYSTIKFALNQLENSGYVRPVRHPTRRGRPEIRYTLTANSAEILPQNATAILLGLLRAAEKLYGYSAPQKLFFLWFQELTETGKKSIQGDNPHDRLRSLARWRNSFGILSRFDTGPPPRLIETYNPIADLFILYPEIAKMEEQMLSRIAGFPLQRIEFTVDNIQQWHFIASIQSY
ncbi:MAG: winged helix-turn-helix transcriptional regulator [Chthoniobacterales bacterium]|nr:winged helix-turn-helix transcriptional regulator [Chthoniobacterales bacterium]